MFARLGARGAVPVGLVGPAFRGVAGARFRRGVAVVPKAGGCTSLPGCLIRLLLSLDRFRNHLLRSLWRDTVEKLGFIGGHLLRHLPLLEAPFEIKVAGLTQIHPKDIRVELGYASILTLQSLLALRIGQFVAQVEESDPKGGESVGRRPLAHCLKSVGSSVCCTFLPLCGPLYCMRFRIVAWSNGP